MRVLSLDPGEQVGWARADVDVFYAAQDDPQPSCFVLTDIRHGITPLWDMVDAVARVIDDEYDVIVMEKWRLYRGYEKQFIGSEFPSVQFIGAVKFLTRRYGVKLVMQGADVQKVGIARAKADGHPLYEVMTKPVAHNDGHDQSALAHLYYYAWRESTR